MYNGIKIKPPFFEVGPKAFLYGESALKLAKALDRISAEYDVQIIFTPQYTDIHMLAQETEHLLIFAQHMDPLPVGRGLGSVLPEAVKAAGATGVMLNHAEKPVDMETLEKTIKRADEIGLATIVCADTPEDAAAIAKFSPNIIVTEPTPLIGTGTRIDDNYVLESIRTVKAVNPDVLVLQGAGISNEDDVYNVIKLGAEATGCTSGIIKAADPIKMADAMIAAVRRAWDERHNG